MKYHVKFKKIINLIMMLSIPLMLSATGCSRTDLSASGNNIICYAAIYNKGVYKSENGGISWYPLTTDQDEISFYSKKLIMSPDGKRLYIATTGAGLFFVDTEKGVLNRLNGFKDEDIRSMAFKKTPDGQHAGSSEFFVGKKETGIYKSLEGTNVWEPCNKGLTYRDVNMLFTSAGNLFAGTINGLFKWDETSKKWLDVSAGVKNKNIFAIDSDSQGKTLYAGAGAYQNAKGRFESVDSLYKSSDYGTSWEASCKGLPDDVLIFSVAVNPRKPERIYLGTSEGIYRSIDSGKKWSKTDDGLPDKLQILDIRIAPAAGSEDLVFAGGANGLFMALDNEKPEWVSRSYGLEQTFVSSILLQTN
jgi:hypothetical protein